MRHIENLLLIIDMQYDFCTPGGSLYVPGAEKDVRRLAGFISRNSDKLEQIILTQDNHQVIDISHPFFWKDNKGDPPEPFTRISAEDVDNKKWTPVIAKEEVAGYLAGLARQGEYPHTIWPEHCIMGSKGAAIVEGIMQVVTDWARKGRFYDLVVKGTHPLTEHFGALRASVPIPGKQETELKSDLANRLKHSKKIFIAGEAKSHCVAATIKQIYEIEDFRSELYLLNDCMSNIPGFEKLADPIYKNAWEQGANLINSDFML